MHVAVCIPVFNDWRSVERLLPELGSVFAAMDHRATVFLVNDGSVVDPSLDKLKQAADGLPIDVALLHLRRNVGHQRAICIGLCHIHGNVDCDSVLVMDGDGEDTPEGVQLLLEAFEESNGDHVVFAKRMRRYESLVFRSGYQAYKMLHRLLVGNGIEVGNFSVVPASQLDSLVTSDDLWNHYAASVMHARIPTRKVPIDRGQRYDGKSTMNTTSLVVHGLSAISVYSDVIGVRLLLGAGMLAVSAVAAIAVVFAVRFLGDQAIAGWATYTTGLLAIIAMQAIIFGFLFSFLVLSERSSINTAPITFYDTLVGRVTTLRHQAPAKP